MKRSKSLEFLAKAQDDPQISARVLAAVERGNKVMAEEVLQIAQEFGYSFTRSEFEKDVRQSIAERFAAGDESLAAVAGKNKPKKSPLSSCARGCLSYTVSWHPSRALRTE
jgi:Nif11 domain